LVRVQPWQPIYGRQADISWLHQSRKQGPTFGAGSITRAFRHLNHQTRGAHHDNHSSIRAEMAASEAAKAHAAETSNRKQEEATASADSAEPDAFSDLLPGRQSGGISSAVAPVIPGSGW